jgi:hypothetical protein
MTAETLRLASVGRKRFVGWIVGAPCVRDVARVTTLGAR